MTATFEIIITGIRTVNIGELTNVIKRVDWTLKGTQDGQTFELPQKTEMGPVDPENFIPLETMTSPATVVAWIEAAETDMSAIQAHIQAVLDRMVAEAVTESVPMPWAPAPEAP